MKQWFTAKELAEAKLPSMPSSQQGVTLRARQLGWEAQPRLGRGGGFEYHINNLPLEARKALESHMAGELLTRGVEPAQSLAPAVTTFGNLPLTEKQRNAADARVTIVNAVNALHSQGVGKKEAIITMLTHAKVGELALSNPSLDKALRMAKGRRGNGSPYPSLRTLWRYLGMDGRAIVPKKRQPDPIPVWANDFLECWQRPEKPSISAAYEEFVANWRSEGEVPSVWAVRRFLKKMGTIAKSHGRMGPRERKNIMPFVRRDFSKLLPADVYSADGHTFDGEVQHPIHGRPFRPEITTWIDIATRRVVGVSVALAESSIAVLDSLIDACRKAIPAVIYVDNGSGYCNALLKDEATGVIARLGSTMTHSIPYNSQARAVIERVHQTLWTSGAKTLPGYIGADMDPEARQNQFKKSRKAIKADGVQPVMGFPEFMEWVQARVAWYNDRSHKTLQQTETTSLVGETPNERWQHFLESEGWEPTTLTGDQAAQVFRPRVTRKVIRGEIQLFANRYFSQELTEWHGEEVQVAYDLNDANYIWLFDQEHNRLICRAEWNANSTDYFPIPFVEQAREKRFEGRLRRNDAKRQEIEEERRGQSLLEHDDSVSLGALGTINGELIRAHSRKSQQLPIEEEIVPLSRFDAMTSEDRYALYHEYLRGERPIEDDAREWVRIYPGSSEYRSKKRRDEYFESQGPVDATHQTPKNH